VAGLLAPLPPATAAPVTSTNLSENSSESALSDVAVSHGSTYVAWQDRGYDPYGYGEVVVASSRDGGASFPHRQNVSRSPGVHSGHPAVAADGDLVYVVWQDTTPSGSPSHGNREVVLAVSRDRGATFSPSRNVSEDVADSIDPRVSASGRHVQVVWKDLGERLWLATSSDTGRTFDKRLIASAVVAFGGPSLVGDAVHLAWSSREGTGSRVHLAAVKAHGAGDLRLTQVAAPTSAAPHLVDVAAWHREVHVLWEERVPRAANGPDDDAVPAGTTSRLALATSYDGGAGFLPPVEVAAASGWIDSADVTVSEGEGVLAWSQAGEPSGTFSRRFSQGAGLGPAVRMGGRAGTGTAVRWSSGSSTSGSAAPTARLSWRTPERFPRSDADGDGLLDYRQEDVAYRHPSAFPVVLDACRSDGGDAAVVRYRWTVAGETRETTACTLEHSFGAEGEHPVRLEVEASDGDAHTLDEQVLVDDLVVVSLGDSVASGEGNPDVPGRSDLPWDPDAVWQDERCDRSALGGPAQAALELEERDTASSVTFLHLACSGASISGDDVAHGGLLTPFHGTRSAVPALPPQVEELRRLLTAPDGQRREVDALLLSIGANDVHFASVVKDCITLDCSRPEHRAAVTERLATLPAKYAALAAALDGLVPADRVFLTEYFDPTRNSSGASDLRCVLDVPGSEDDLDVIDDTEARYAGEEVLGGLNGAVHAAAAAHGWNVVSGIADGFTRHGYCADEHWVVRLGETFAQQDNEFGAFHPNLPGHQLYGRRIVETVAPTLRRGGPDGGAGQDGAARLVGADLALGWEAGGVVSVTGVDPDDPHVDPVGTVQVSSSPEGGYAGAVRVAATPDGAVATWTQHQATAGVPIGSTGPMEVFVAGIPFGQPDLELRSVRPVQGPDDPERLVAGKPLAVELEAHNGLGSARHVFVRVTVTEEGPDGGRVKRDELMTVGLQPGLSTVHLAPDPPIEPTADAHALRVTATLDPDDLLEESDDGNNTATSEPLPVAQSRRYKVLYVPLAVGDGEPVGCRAVEEVARDGGAWVTETFPVADEESLHTPSCESVLRVPAGEIDDQQLADALLQADQLARSTGFDAVVAVAPGGWFGSTPVASATGLAVQGDPGSTSPPGAGVIVESGSPGRVVAHELAHLFGAEHLDGVPAAGYHVAEHRRESGLDLMDRVDGPDRWISRETYAFLLDRLQLTPEDPPILVLRGTVAPDGSVQTGTWYRQMGLLDVELGATGELALDYLDGTGARLASTGFDVHAVEEPHNGEASEGMQGFAVRVPDVPGTTRLVLRRGDRVVHERTVSPAAPTLSLTAPAAGATLAVGTDAVVEWDAADVDGDALRSAVWLSADEGTSWVPLATDVAGGRYAFTPSRHLLDAQLRVKVLTSDGVNTTEAVSEPFRVVSRPVAGGGGRIAYADRGRIWLMTEDGRLQTDVSGSAAGSDADPALSPDGLRLAFESRRGDRYGPTQVWVSNADGSDARSVGAGYDPAWSPDGSRLAFVRDAVYGGVSQPHVAVMARDGSSASVLLRGRSPAWSPSGDAIAFQESVGSQALSVMNPDGTGKRQLITDWNEAFTSPAWSPDGSEIAYVGSRSEAVRAVPITGGAPRGLTPDGAAAYGSGRGLAWSPDGSSIAYYSSTDAGLVVRALVSGEVRPLTPHRFSPSDAADPSWVVGTTVVPGDDGGTGMLVFARSSNLYTVRSDGTQETRLPDGLGGRDPVWSPDGTRIAYVAYGSVRLMDADGVQRRIVADGSMPDWSPDGTRVVYHSSRDGRTDLWVTDLTTGTETRLTDSGAATSAAWSPDGQTVVYVGPPADPTAGSSDLWLLDVATGAVRAVPDTASLTESTPAWSPDGSQLAFGVGYDTWLVAVDGTQRRVLARGYDPAWSPDGQRVAMTSETLHPLGGYQVVLVPVDGSRVAHLPGVTGATDWKLLPVEPGEPGGPEEPVAAPPAEAGGPYTGEEGGPIRLDASGSAPVVGEVPLFAWDLDADGAYDDATGPGPDVVFDDDGPRTIGLQVTRSDGTQHTDAAEVSVGNAAPVVLSPGPTDAAAGRPVSLGAGHHDPGADQHTATVDWGDGTVSAATVSAGAVVGEHTFASVGRHAVTVTVCDEGGACGSAEVPVTVLASLPPSVEALDQDSSGVPGGSTVTVLGVGYTDGAAVRFGEVAASDVRVVSDRVLEVVVPRQPAGRVHVRVTTAAGTSAATAASAFAYENARPEAQDVTASVSRGGTVDVDVVASDPDGDPVTLLLLDGPAAGALTWIDGDTLRYTAPAQPGVHRASVVASDGTDASEVRTVTLHVLDEAPVAHPDVVTLVGDGPATVPLADLLANDEDHEGDPLSVVAAFVPLGGAGEVQLTDSAVLFQPPPDAVGTVGFAYVVGDGHGRSAVGRVSVVRTEAPVLEEGIRPRIRAERDRLLASGSQHERVQASLRALDRALEDDGWLSDDVLTDRGSQILTALQSATGHLAVLEQEEDAGEADRALAAAALGVLVDAARELATGAIETAGTEPLEGREAVQRDHALTAARAELARGDALVEVDPAGAVARYRQAWQHARRV
jgi:Tol biopolymer transport system component